jgi:hypothetical protein
MSEILTPQELAAARDAIELLPQWDAPLCESERQIWWNTKAGLLEDARAAGEKLLAEIDRLRGERAEAVVAERERVLGLMRTHAQKYLAGRDRLQFEEVVEWISVDARNAAPDATVPPPCTSMKSAR